MQIIRNLESHPGFAPGLRMFSKKLTNASGGDTTYTFETKCVSILFALCVNAAGTVSMPVIAASTLMTGTYKVTVTVPNGSNCRYLVVGLGEDSNDDEVAVDTNTAVTFVD